MRGVKRGMIDDAIRETKIAIKADNSGAMLHNNLGVLYSRKSLFSDAKTEFEIAVRLKPEYEIAIRNLEKARMILKESPANTGRAPTK